MYEQESVGPVYIYIYTATATVTAQPASICNVRIINVDVLTTCSQSTYHCCNEILMFSRFIKLCALEFAQKRRICIP